MLYFRYLLQQIEGNVLVRSMLFLLDQLLTVPDQSETCVDLTPFHSKLGFAQFDLSN